MFGVVVSAYLLNYLPLRPGMAARIAYHKRMQHLPLRRNVRILAEAGSTTAATSATLVLAMVAAAPLHLSAPWVWLGVFIIVVIVASFKRFRFWGVIAIWRLLDLFSWSFRLWAAFQLVDQRVTFATATAIASAGIIVNVVPLVSNGLGLREWATGLLAPWLAGAQLALGLAVELVIRACELVIVIPVGLLSTSLLARELRRNKDKDEQLVNPQE
jgi:hypothetical protein